jgi:hypothetical protein
MRLSVDKDDPGCVEGISCTRVTVFFNGEEKRTVITADEEQGMIVCAVLDEMGRVQIDKAKGEAMKETLYGNVRIEVPDDHPLLSLIKARATQ